MKPLTIAFSIAVLALPLLAQTEDSPLVRAAKATGRLSKKPKIVITNDTLVLSGGHLATTDATTPFKQGAESYSNLPATVRPASAAPAPTPQPTTATNTVQLPTATMVQPSAGTAYQPPPSQPGQVTTATTVPVSYSGTAQPATAPVKPPQP